MWGRFEAIKRQKIVILHMTIFFLSIAPGGAIGQSLPDRAVSLLEREAERGGGDLELLVDYCEQLIMDPVNINRASEVELSSFPLLSPFQVASVLEYRESYGDILSEGELALVDGFNEEFVRAILPFITFGEGGTVHPPHSERISSRLVLRSNKKFEKGSPFGYYGQYKFGMGDKMEVGGTLSAGGISAHLKVGNVKLGEKVLVKSGVVGDFTVRMGQGLLLWNSFSLSGSGDPSALLRRGGGVVHYSGSSPDEVFRGAGVSLVAQESLEGTIFYGDCGVIGGGTGYSWDRFRIGVNFTVSGERIAGGSYVGKRVSPDGGGVSVDGLWSMGRYRIFGECAVDFEGNEAMLAGALLPISEKIELGVAIRWYSPLYDAIFSGGYSSVSSCKNQLGGVINLLWRPLGGVVVRGFVDAVHYPAPRYGVKIPSTEVESSLEGEWSSDAGHLISVSGRYRYYGGEGRNQYGLRINYLFKPSSGLYGGFRGEVAWNNVYKGRVPPGIALYLECGYRGLNEKWEVVCRGTVYHIDSWDNRIYFYERDLPRSFSVPALYRRGWDIYGYIKYAPLRRVGLYLKVSTKVVKGQLTLTF